MKIRDVAEWMHIAEDDFYSAKTLNESIRKPHEIICYHCAQAIEKYLKGYLAYNDVMVPKTHNLPFPHELCVEKDGDFETVRTECSLLNRFTNEIRYPHRIEVREEDVSFSLAAVEKIKNLEPIKTVRNSIKENERKE